MEPLASHKVARVRALDPKGEARPTTIPSFTALAEPVLDPGLRSMNVYDWAEASRATRVASSTGERRSLLATIGNLRFMSDS